MIPVQRLVDDILEALIRVGSDDQDKVERTINLSYRDICEGYAWDALRRSVSLNFSNADANGEMLLPADLAGIEAVWDSDGHEYFPTSKQQRHDTDTNEQYHYRYYLGSPVTSPLHEKKEFGISQNATTFTMTTAWDADWVGEYIRIGSDMGIYEITGEKTIHSAWRGAKETSSWGSIRPEGTKRLGLLDPAGAAAGKTVTVYYWAYPLPLTQGHHQVLLPHSDCLKYKVLADIVGPKDRRRSAAVDYYALASQALTEAKARNPRFLPTRLPRNRIGQPMRFK